MELRVERFSKGNQADFFDFHSRVGGECFCAAWWVPTWDEWRTRSGEDNRQLRNELLQRGEYDGYLIYADGKAAGWCQVGKRDRLQKLGTQFRFELEEEIWAITCFQIDPDMQRRGLASELLKSVLADLKQRGAKRVQGYPKIDAGLPAHAQWTGPLGLFEKAGFKKLRDNRSRAVYEIEL